MTWQPRNHASFRHAFLAALPVGAIWPRSEGSVLWKIATALTAVTARWASRAGQFLLVEAFPPRSLTTLADWERVFGLPEPCLTITSQTLAERQQALLGKLQRRPGRQDRQYLIDLAATIGYAITITEFIPFTFALSGLGWTSPPYCGFGWPQMRFVWSVKVSGPRITWYSVGALGGRFGTDTHLTIARASDLECLLRKLKPAHTNLIFNYTGV